MYVNVLICVHQSRTTFQLHEIFFKHASDTIVPEVPVHAVHMHHLLVPPRRIGHPENEMADFQCMATIIPFTFYTFMMYMYCCSSRE